MTTATEQKLLKSYRTAARELSRTIERANPKKPVVFLRRTVLVDINAISEALERETRSWLEEEIPKEYKLGSHTAIRECQKQGLRLERTAFGQVHQEAIETLVEDAYLDFANGIEGVKRAGRGFLSELVKMKINERIIVGQIKGDGLYKIKREVKKLIEEQGFTALKDRGGKNWKIDRYAEMLVRTHVLKANNAGIKNRLLENKVELVEFSKHGGSCEICAPYESKVFSLTGDSKEHEKAPDLPLHPNCRHSYLPVVD
jgi:hypothetical protein